jgi:hypothetical protein
MRLLGTFPSLRSTRNPLVSVGIFAVVMYAAYQAAQAVIANDFMGLALSGLLVAGAFVALVIQQGLAQGVVPAGGLGSV